MTCQMLHPCWKLGASGGMETLMAIEGRGQIGDTVA